MDTLRYVLLPVQMVEEEILDRLMSVNKSCVSKHHRTLQYQRQGNNLLSKHVSNFTHLV